MKKLISIALTASLALALAGCTRDDHDQHDAAGEERRVLYWYDPMHPGQRFDKPGPSPFMDMDLVPRYADEVEVGVIHVTPGIQQVMNIRTADVELGRLWRRIDTIGRVGYDESRLHHFHPRVQGWIESVNINAVGDPVTDGHVLFTLYSPELVNAQEEFLRALTRGERATIAAARERLRALDVQPDAIAELVRTRSVIRAVPWRARHDGVVTKLGIRHGMFVTPGDLMLETANLSSVWVTADVYDRHVAWLDVGQSAEISLPYAPGEVRDATITHVYPQLNEATRTVRVRLPLENPDGHLKPGMWNSVRIFSGPVDGVVMIPREALIRTGQATRVVLRDDATRFRVRTVVPGMESGDWVEIREGLEPGETVVVSGQFLIDSEASLRSGHGRLEGVGHQH